MRHVVEAEWQARQKARLAVAADVGTSEAPKQLKERLTRLEQAVGLRPVSAAK